MVFVISLALALFVFAVIFEIVGLSVESFSQIGLFVAAVGMMVTLYGLFFC